MSLGLDEGILLGSDDGIGVIAQSPSFTVMVAVSGIASDVPRESTVTVLVAKHDEMVPRQGLKNELN